MATGTITAEEFVHTILNADSPAGFDGKLILILIQLFQKYRNLAKNGDAEIGIQAFQLNFAGQMR